MALTPKPLRIKRLSESGAVQVITVGINAKR